MDLPSESNRFSSGSSFRIILVSERFFPSWTSTMCLLKLPLLQKEALQFGIWHLKGFPLSSTFPMGAVVSISKKLII